MNKNIKGVIDLIDIIIEPKLMSKEEALEFLTELSSELEMRIEALNEDIASEGET
jgi:hypothetical protein